MRAIYSGVMLTMQEFAWLIDRPIKDLPDVYIHEQGEWRAVKIGNVIVYRYFDYQKGASHAVR